MTFSVLLDTSFLIRLLKNDDPLHQNTLGYFRYFIEQKIQMKLSTVSIAEYCVRGKVEDLPLKNLTVLPFNFNHGIIAGKFANILFTNRNKIDLMTQPRTIIPNDSKLFAQAEIEDEIKFFVTSDTNSIGILNVIKSKTPVRFEIIDVKTPFNNTFGILDI